MGVLYNPSSLEWTNLIMLLSTGLVSGAIYVGFALASNWTIWWRKLHTPAPVSDPRQKLDQRASCSVLKTVSGERTDGGVEPDVDRVASIL